MVSAISYAMPLFSVIVLIENNSGPFLIVPDKGLTRYKIFRFLTFQFFMPSITIKPSMYLKPRQCSKPSNKGEQRDKSKTGAMIIGSYKFCSNSLSGEGFLIIE